MTVQTGLFLTACAVHDLDLAIPNHRNMVHTEQSHKHLQDTKHIHLVICVVFFNIIYFAVAEMPYHTQLRPQRYEIDFSKLTLPAGLTAGEIKKITIRPEYKTFLGDGQAESLIGQIFIDNIRWSSAEE